MTTYIDRIITEVAVTPDRPESGSETDKRWADARKIEAAIKARARKALRIRAEGRDD